MQINIKRTDNKAIVPTKKNISDAGYDLYSIEEFTLLPGQRHLYKTGINIQIPEGYYGRVAPRSGLAFKQGFDVLAGVVDSGYLGDVSVILINHSETAYHVGVGDRIAQLIIEKCHHVDFIEQDVLVPTDRGSDGFGSTGK